MAQLILIVFIGFMACLALAESTTTARVPPAVSAPTSIEAQHCITVRQQIFASNPSHLEVYECFSQKNLAQCPLVRRWGQRQSGRGRNSASGLQYQARLLQKKMDDFKPLIPQLAENPECFPNQEHLKNNFCFFSANLNDFYLKQYKEGGPEYIVLRSNNLSGLELVRSTAGLGEKKFPGISSMLIAKKGAEPFVAGENNIFGHISFGNRSVQLAKGTLTTAQEDYLEQKITTTDYGIDTTTLSFASLSRPQTLCGDYASLTDLVNQAKSKAGADFSLEQMASVRQQALNDALATGAEKGAANLIHSGKSAIDSMKTIGQLATNGEVPDPEGTMPCQEPANIAAAAEFGGRCSRIREVMRRSFGEAFEAVAQECYKLNCVGKSAEMSERRCLEFNSQDPQFQSRMSACYARKVAQKMGTDAWNHVVDCVTKGADRFSQCAADVAVAGALTIAGSGAFKAISGISASSKNAILAAAAAGKLSKTSARLLLASQQMAKSGSMFTADLLFNQLPTDLDALYKWQVALRQLSGSPDLSQELKDLAEKKLDEVSSAIAKKTDSEHPRNPLDAAKQTHRSQNPRVTVEGGPPGGVGRKAASEFVHSEKTAVMELEKVWDQLPEATQKKSVSQLVGNAEGSLTKMGYKVQRQIGVDGFDSLEIIEMPGRAGKFRERLKRIYGDKLPKVVYRPSDFVKYGSGGGAFNMHDNTISVDSLILKSLEEGNLAYLKHELRHGGRAAMLVKGDEVTGLHGKFFFSEASPRRDLHIYADQAQIDEADTYVRQMADTAVQARKVVSEISKDSRYFADPQNRRNFESLLRNMDEEYSVTTGMTRAIRESTDTIRQTLNSRPIKTFDPDSNSAIHTYPSSSEAPTKFEFFTNPELGPHGLIGVLFPVRRAGGAILERGQNELLTIPVPRGQLAVLEGNPEAAKTYVLEQLKKMDESALAIEDRARDFNRRTRRPLYNQLRELREANR